MHAATTNSFVKAYTTNLLWRKDPCLKVAVATVFVLVIPRLFQFVLYFLFSFAHLCQEFYVPKVFNLFAFYFSHWEFSQIP